MSTLQTHSALFSILIILAFSTGGLAQNSPQNSPPSPKFDKGWFTFAVGNDYSANENVNQRLAIAFTANWGRTQFWQAGLSLNSTIFSGGEIATLYGARGISAVNRFFRVSIAGGPALLAIQEDRNNGKDLHEITLGFVGDAQLLFTPVKEVGLGLQFHGNLNFKDQLGGPRLVLVIEGHK